MPARSGAFARGVARRLALLALVALPLLADETAIRVIHSGQPFGRMRLLEAGLDGRGEIVAVVDTGIDPDACQFAEADGSLPPLNTSVEGTSIDPARRKVIAYDFLFSCEQYPGAFGCDDPAAGGAAFDNFGHGTLVASLAAGDGPPYGAIATGDGVAPGAQLVIQDTGYRPAHPCALPGLGCPPGDLTPVLDQAYAQGARVQTHQWGDRVAAYGLLAHQVDAFVAAHPDTVVVFNAGNAGQAGGGTVTSPGVAKNAIQVGGTRALDFDDSVIWEASGRGPSADGRLKPDLVAPSFVYGALSDGAVGAENCAIAVSGGTSYSAPLVAGAAAIVRQYFREGRYPTGEPRERDRRTPSAALVKAALVASARRVPFVDTPSGRTISAPTPSFEQGFGLPVLEDVLPLPGSSRRLLVVDRADQGGLADGEIVEIEIESTGGPIAAALVWTDPPAPANAGGLVHDLDLELVAPDGSRFAGNGPVTGAPFDRMNNVERVAFDAAAAGTWRLRVLAHRVAPAARQGFAVVVTGALEAPPARRRPVARPATAASHTPMRSTPPM